jgi:hypothetical protein
MNGKLKGERRKAEVSNACLAACVLAAVTLSLPAMAQQQEPLGRLFFTPAQRSSLDVARSQRARTTLATERTEEQAAPQEQTITYGGMVRRSDGGSTVWLNGRPVHERETIGGATVVGRIGADGSVSLQNPQSGRSVALKPGQSLELLSGTIEEGYARKPVAPEPKPEAKPAINDKKGAKPSAEEIAKTERERQDQEKQRLEDALRAIQDAGTLNPAPAAAPLPPTGPATQPPAR